MVLIDPTLLFIGAGIIFSPAAGIGLLTKPVAECQPYPPGVFDISVEGAGIGYIGGLVAVFARMEDIIDCQAQAGLILPYIFLNGGIGIIYGTCDILGGKDPASGAEVQFRAPSFLEPELIKEVARGGKNAFVHVHAIDVAFVDEVAKPAKEVYVPPFDR